MKAFKPLAINGYLPDGENKALYGGKAVSLYKLGNLYGHESYVPSAWVIPCEMCAKRPEIDLSAFDEGGWEHYKYAVRSGAPISMPGLMATELNVKPENLTEAIHKVWDSWDTPHAKAYRAAKGLPDTMGTAVIIQRMVDALYAGTTFTSDPSKGKAHATYEPIIEYVEGLGDKLVDGTTKPMKMVKGHAYYIVVNNYMLSIHNTFGPSDVEWCIDKAGSLRLIQMRPIQFPSSVVEEAIDETGLTLIGKGEPVGAPNKRTCVIRLATNVKDIKPGEAVYVAEFRPEYYPLMIKASAILCGTGGATCHASIIARELDKPAISGIDDELVYVTNGKPVVIDGATGKIYKHDGEHTADTVQQMVKVLDETRIPNEKVLNKTQKYRVCWLLPRFYTTISDWQQGKASEERKNFVAREIADVFCLYYFRACLGEMRHFHTKGTAVEKGSQVLARRIGSLITEELPKTAMSREAFVGKIKHPETLKEAINIMRAVETGFKRFKWPGGYGGLAWGNIATALLKYLVGEYSPVMFVDVCFNLRHNGGIAFNKFDWMGYQEDLLTAQLDVKQSGDMKKLLKMTGDYFSSSQSLLEYIDRESIFYEGTKNVKEGHTTKTNGKDKAKGDSTATLATAA